MLWVQWFISRKTIPFQDSRRVQHFPGEVQLLPGGGGGVQLLIPMKTYRPCDFPGGGGGPDPLSPL